MSPLLRHIFAMANAPLDISETVHTYSNLLDLAHSAQVCKKWNDSCASLIKKVIASNRGWTLSMQLPPPVPRIPSEQMRKDHYEQFSLRVSRVFWTNSTLRFMALNDTVYAYEKRIEDPDTINLDMIQQIIKHSRAEWSAKIAEDRKIALVGANDRWIVATSDATNELPPLVQVIHAQNGRIARIFDSSYFTYPSDSTDPTQVSFTCGQMALSGNILAWIRKVNSAVEQIYEIWLADLDDRRPLLSYKLCEASEFTDRPKPYFMLDSQFAKSRKLSVYFNQRNWSSIDSIIYPFDLTAYLPNERTIS